MFDDLEKYKSVIGLEVRVQHPTNSHLFSVDSTPFGNLPNHNECIVSPDLTGSSRMLNKQIIEDVIEQHLSIQLKNFKQFPFHRKNYFYNDISKGFQISWDKTPICLGVFIKVKRKNGWKKKMLLTKFNIEGDAGILPKEKKQLYFFSELCL